MRRILAQIAVFTTFLGVTPAHAQESSMMMQLEGNTSMTRAEFVSMLIDDLYVNSGIPSHCYQLIDSVPETPFTYLFTDVRSDDPYARNLCVAMHVGLVKGYRDGSFRPNESLNSAEAIKIIAKAYGLYASGEQGLWYAPYVDALAARNAIPSTMTDMAANPTRDQLYWMISRVMNDVV